MGKPRVALVFPTLIRRNAFYGMTLPALGLERLGAAIEDMATPELFDARFEQDLVGEVRRFSPEVVAVSVKTTMHASRSYAIGRQIREALPNARIVTGGLHASACPEESLAFADYAIMGEGENAFRSLVQGEDPTGIAGAVFRDGASIRRNEKAPPMMNLDVLKPPARHLRKPHYRYSAAGHIPMDLLETSRGCTHACSFCSGGSVYPHKYRVHSPEYVFEEVQRIAHAGAKWCFLTDDHLGDHDRVDAICDLILKSGTKIAFFTFIRPFLGRMDLKRKMVRAGFVMVSYGAESASKDQLTRYGKGHPKEQDYIKRINREWFDAGACYVGNSYVFGDVGDSAADLLRLGAYARSLDPGYIEPLYSQPYPGTRYREELAELSMLNDRASDWNHFTEGRLLVKHPELDEDGMKKARVKLWLDFFSPRKIVRQLWFHHYLHEKLGIDRNTLLKHLSESVYTMFGCYLEDKYYLDRYPDMVETYFRESIRRFETEEMDMSDRIEGVTNLLGLASLKSLLCDFDLLLKVRSGAECLATVILCVRDKRATSARAIVGEPSTEYPSVTIDVELSILKELAVLKEHYNPTERLRRQLRSAQLVARNGTRIVRDSVRLVGSRLFV